jgi:hypothetical protein
MAFKLLGARMLAAGGVLGVAIQERRQCFTIGPTESPR